MDFKDFDLGTLQEVLFPLIASLTGVDPAQYVKDSGAALHTTADELRLIADFVDDVGGYADDGILDTEEINQVIADSPTIYDAVKRMADAVKAIDGKPDGAA